MASCEICQRSGQSGHNVSHSKRHTKTRWFVNVQKATVNVNGEYRKINICSRCLRTHYKELMKT
ncbi:MAG: 50S ribosomal protein L28 [Chloroflexi bacterium]|nr:50S ribosomal protein L28 [Chloroflexota bacterium]